MDCCQCQGIEEVFGHKLVTKKLSRYRAKGADKTTRMLIEAIKASGVEGLTLLDIGGGIGAIQHDLLSAGVRCATDVDASTAYLNAAKTEAQRRGYAHRVNYYQGNFVDLASEISPADIVTLDRVICCYHDMEKLVSLSAARAQKLYGLVYPRDVWWVKVVLALGNLFSRLQRSPFRAYAHSTQAVESLVNNNGLERKFHRQTMVWQVVVFSR